MEGSLTGDEAEGADSAFYDPGTLRRSTMTADDFAADNEPRPKWAPGAINHPVPAQQMMAKGCRKLSIIPFLFINCRLGDAGISWR
jgi:hypothetical protein